MRSVALIAALACATMAHADGVRESRYGPERERAPTPLNGSQAYGAQPYAGRTLGWSGKRADVAPPAPTRASAPQAQTRPWWSNPIATPTQPAFQPQAVRAPIPQAQVPQAPIPQASARALPQTIYDAPIPLAGGPPQQQQAYAPQAAAPRALLPGQTTARTYSVGRQFGLQPDPIPAAGPSRMVLVGPPATAPDDEAAPRDDRDWPAADRKDDTK